MSILYLHRDFSRDEHHGKVFKYDLDAMGPMGPGPKWAKGPNGPRAQVGPGPK